MKKKKLTPNPGLFFLVFISCGSFSCLLSSCSSSSTTSENKEGPSEGTASESSETAPEAGTDAPPTASTPPPAEGSKWSGTSSLGNLKLAPFDAGGTVMNALYFTRKSGETWGSISEKIYGTPDRAEDLKKWNKATPLNAGTAIYYNSPVRPNDTSAMRIFADDLGLPFEKIQVQAGDSLSKIAQRIFGDPRAWKEIAVLNPSLSNLDRVTPGTILIVQPVNLELGQASGNAASAENIAARAGAAGADPYSANSAAYNQAAAGTTQSIGEESGGDPSRDPSSDSAQAVAENGANMIRGMAGKITENVSHNPMAQKGLGAVLLASLITGFVVWRKRRATS